MATIFRRLLPTDMTAADRKELEEAGVGFHEKAEGWNDQTYVTLPEGWHISKGNHGQWSSDLIDSDGRIRACMAHRLGRAFLFIKRT